MVQLSKDEVNFSTIVIISIIITIMNLDIPLVISVVPFSLKYTQSMKVLLQFMSIRYTSPS